MMGPGKFRARGVTAALGESSNGNAQVAVEFQLLDEPNQTVVWYGFFTEATFNRTVESLRYCGWAGDDLSDLTGIDQNEVELVLANDEYQGKVRLKVQWVNKPGGGAMLKQQMTPESARAFGAMMKSRVKALGIGTNPVDDKIPF